MTFKQTNGWNWIFSLNKWIINNSPCLLLSNENDQNLGMKFILGQTNIFRKIIPSTSVSLQRKTWSKFWFQLWSWKCVNLKTSSMSIGTESIPLGQKFVLNLDNLAHLANTVTHYRRMWISELRIFCNRLRKKKRNRFK